jgi:hypothetical protein
MPVLVLVAAAGLAATSPSSAAQVATMRLLRNVCILDFILFLPALTAGLPDHVMRGYFRQSAEKHLRCKYQF